MSEMQLLEAEQAMEPVKDALDESLMDERAGEPRAGEPPAGEPCQNCGAVIETNQLDYCRSCGFYPSMGTFIELDPWEQAGTDDSAQGEPPLSLLQVWLHLLPAWAWKLIGCHAVVLLVNISVALTAPYGSAFRTIWSVSQLFIGFGLFATCHILIYLAAIAENADLGILDILLKPFRIWAPIVRRLPTTFDLIVVGTCSLNAVLMSLLVVGALPYHVLWDWHIKDRPKQNLVSAIVTHAMESEGNDDGLDDAIENFAGTTEDEAAKKQQLLDGQRRSHDCLIIGYTLNEKGDRIRSLILAREFQGHMMIIGSVVTGIEDEIRESYVAKFRKIGRSMPFIHTAMEAQWVDPVYTCRVTHGKRSPTGTLNDMRYGKMLGSID